VTTPFTPEAGFDYNDGAPVPNRPPFEMGGNIWKCEEPNYGTDKGGNTTLSNIDEREVLSDSISAIPICFDPQNSEPEWSGHRQGVYKHRGA